MSTIKVLLVDDHRLLRAGLRSLLERVKGCEVVGEAGSGIEALELIRKLRPDAVLMDIAMKDMNGIEAAAKAKQEFPELRIIVLSMHAEDEYVTQALRAGAAGYMLKDAATTELELALDVVMKGNIYLSPSISKQIAEGYLRGVESANPAAALSPRQREILTLIAEGHSTKEIAHRLKLSVKTVETHRNQMMDRLAIRDVAGLTRFAIRAGLVKLDK